MLDRLILRSPPMALIFLGHHYRCSSSSSPSSLLPPQIPPPTFHKSSNRSRAPVSAVPRVVHHPIPFHFGERLCFFSSSSSSFSYLHCSSNDSSVSVATPVEGEEQADENGGNNRTRLIAQNIPWDYTVDDVRTIFEKHGVVDDVELSMYSSNKNRGLAFITMGSKEEATEALSNLHLQELGGRIIRVEFARSTKKKPPPVTEPIKKYNVFVGNLTWRVRSRDLRELFSASNPNVLSAEVIFQTNPRRSAGYGFASFATKEEAEVAVATLNGKKLRGRAIRLVLGNGKTENGGSNKPNEATELHTKSIEVSDSEVTLKVQSAE